MRLPFFKKRGDRALDPVCDMQMDVNRPPDGSHEYNGETYYFCGPGQPGVSEGAGGVLVRGEEAENVGVVRQARVEGWVGVDADDGEGVAGF